MHILITRSNPVSPDPRVEKIGRALIGAGYSVQALGWDRTGNLPEQETREGLPIYRLPIRAEFGTGLGNLRPLLKWQWGLWRWLLQHKTEFDAIHACDFDTILPAIWLKTFFGKRVVYDIFDFYADMLRQTPSLIVNLLRRAELWAINRADAVILADEARLKQIRGAHPRRCIILYNSPEDYPIPRLVEKPAAGEGCALRLSYVGNLQIQRGLLVLLDVFSRHPEWSLDLAGSGPDQERILSLARQMANVTWHGRVPYARALELNASADTLLATYDPAIPNHRYSSANKLFEAMQLGKPIIVAYDTHMDEIVEQIGCGLVVTYGSAEELESALFRLQSDVALRAELGIRSRQAYDTTFSWSRMQVRLLALYQELAA